MTSQDESPWHPRRRRSGRTRPGAWVLCMLMKQCSPFTFDLDWLVYCPVLSHHSIIASHMIISWRLYTMQQHKLENANQHLLVNSKWKSTRAPNGCWSHCKMLVLGNSVRVFFHYWQAILDLSFSKLLFLSGFAQFVAWDQKYSFIKAFVSLCGCPLALLRIAFGAFPLSSTALRVTTPEPTQTVTKMSAKA